jgi:hypothetical protein
MSKGKKHNKSSRLVVLSLKMDFDEAMRQALLKAKKKAAARRKK